MLAGTLRCVKRHANSSRRRWHEWSLRQRTTAMTGAVGVDSVAGLNGTCFVGYTVGRAMMKPQIPLLPCFPCAVGCTCGSWAAGSTTWVRRWRATPLLAHCPGGAELMSTACWPRPGSGGSSATMARAGESVRWAMVAGSGGRSSSGASAGATMRSGQFAASNSKVRGSPAASLSGGGTGMSVDVCRQRQRQQCRCQMFSGQHSDAAAAPQQQQQQ